MPNATDQPKTWNVAVLNIDWQADRHNESHSIEFERPTADNPRPEFPVVAGGVLSTSRLPMSSEWGRLFAPVVVKAFDEESLTIQYGQHEYVVRPDGAWKKLGRGGMNYTTFGLYIGVRHVEPKKAVDEPLSITHDEKFLRRFRLKERIMRLTGEDVQLLRQWAADGDVFAQYGLGRWLYCMAPTDTSMREAEELFLSSINHVSDALAAYAMMWHYGETRENAVDLEKSNLLLQQALHRGSQRAAQQLARLRLFGLHCDAEPETVAREIEQRIEAHADNDPYWYALLAFAYEQLDRQDDAIRLYEKAIAQGDIDNYLYEAAIYYERGNMALYDSLMEEGISKGSTACFLYRVDTAEDDFQQLSAKEQQQLHEQIDTNLRLGLSRGDGSCGYWLWTLSDSGTLGFHARMSGRLGWLKRGAQLVDVNCMECIAKMADDGDWYEPMTQAEKDELWLKIARYRPHSRDALRRLKQCGASTFLLHHKDELERYWQPLWEKAFPAVEPRPALPPKTPIEPMVIIIWPTGHMHVEQVDVSQIPTYREMGRQLIGADGLDAVRYTPLLHTVGEAAELDHELVMYVDRDAQAKQLADNAIGTLLYGCGEVRGPIIICQEDQRHDCLSFTTQEDLTATYNEINNHCDGLLIIKDEDDGRYDAYV